MSAKGAGLKGTLAQGVLPDGGNIKKTAESGPGFIILPADTDWRKLAIAMIQASGIVVITGDKKPGGQHGTRAKPHESKVPRLPPGVVLPTGIVLRRHVELLRADDPKLSIKAALRQLLETAVTLPLKEQGASKTKIKSVIEGNLPGLISRYHAKPRKKTKQ